MPVVDFAEIRSNAASVSDPATADRERWHSFGQWIFQRRVAELGWSRREAAEAAGLSISTLQNLEEGGRNYRGEWVLPSPSMVTLRGLARGLDLPLNEVLERCGREMLPATGDDAPGPELDFNSQLAQLPAEDRQYVISLVERLLRERQ